MSSWKVGLTLHNFLSPELRWLGHIKAAAAAQQLADAIYIYASAVNETLEVDPINGTRNGRLITSRIEGKNYSGLFFC